MKKKFCFFVLTSLLIVGSFSSSLMAIPIHDSAPVTHSSDKAQATEDNADKQCPGRPHHRRPFHRFSLAIQELRESQLINSDEIQKVYEALVKIPPETLEKAADKDMTIADTLYKDKVLTEAQYQKIVAFLKKNPMPKRETSNN